MPIQIQCTTCKKYFPISPSRVGTKKFCSADCYTVQKRKKVYNQHLKRRIVVTCEFCKKSFETNKYREVTVKYCSKSCAAKSKHDEMAAHWKGDEVEYGGIHHWIKRKLGKANHCSNCKGVKAKRFEWANISGKYLRSIDDWIQLCPSCHRIFDNSKH